MTVTVDLVVAGRLYDQYKSHDVSFYMSGALIIVSALGFCTLEMKCFSKNVSTVTDNQAGKA